MYDGGVPTPPVFARDAGKKRMNVRPAAAHAQLRTTGAARRCDGECATASKAAPTEPPLREDEANQCVAVQANWVDAWMRSGPAMRLNNSLLSVVQAQGTGG